MKRELKDSGATAGGVGASGLAVSVAPIKSIRLGKQQLTLDEILVIEISNVNQLFKALGETHVDGIIGSDWMNHHKAVLDVSDQRLF